MAKSRWLSLTWIVVAALLAGGGAVVSTDQDPGGLPARLRPFAIIALIVGLAGVAVWILRWFRRRLVLVYSQLDVRFLPQPDGTYLVRHVHGTWQDIRVHRVDKATKDRVLAWDADRAIAYGVLWLLMLFCMFAVYEFWPGWAWAALVVSLVLVLLATVAMARWTNRRTVLLITSGPLAPYVEWDKSPRPPVDARLDPQLLIGIFGAVLIIGCILSVDFFVNPDTGTVTLDGQSLAFVLLLVVLPAAVIILGVWRLRRQRRAAPNAP